MATGARERRGASTPGRSAPESCEHVSRLRHGRRGGCRQSGGARYSGTPREIPHTIRLAMPLDGRLRRKSGDGKLARALPLGLALVFPDVRLPS